MSDLDEHIAARRAEAKAWVDAGLGILCVNYYSYRGTSIFCGHRAHPGKPCSVRGSTSMEESCDCKESKQVSQREEDILILKRNLPQWHHERLNRLTETTDGK